LIVVKQVGELQGELRLQKQQFGLIVSQRDKLLEKIDSLSLDIVTLESNLSKEKTHSDMLEVCTWIELIL